MRPSHVGKTQVVQSYGNLWIYCEPDEFHRLQKILIAEAGIDDTVAILHDQLRSVAITSRPIVTDKSTKLHWHDYLTTIITGCVSGPAIIIGYIAIFRWILARLS
jgi:NhaP-type Na+/H+ or K+/H+ antiporter